MKTKLLIIGFSFLLFLGCSRPRTLYPLPEQPSQGLNHLYFYGTINGGYAELYVASPLFTFITYDPGITYNPLCGNHQQGTSITATKYKEPRFYLSLFFYNGINHTGIYPLSDTDISTVPLCDTSLNQHQAGLYLGGEKYVSKDHCGNIKINYLSPDKKEFKGIFNMTLYNANNSQDSIVIRNGDFWIHIDSLRQRTP